MMNERARKILAYIERFTRENNYPPTIREIGKAFGIASTNGVRYHLNILQKGGHLTRAKDISRGIGTKASRRPAGIPIVGRVAAGQPILAEQNQEGTIETSEMFGDPNGLFALQVRGDSMIEAGILAGDYVIVRSQDRANAGEIVVAQVGEEATVKYYRPEEDGIVLVPANERLSPMRFEPDEVAMFGRVVTVLRRL